MTIAIEVDGSIEFVFDDGWLAIKWDDDPARAGRYVSGRKAVDVAAAGKRALLIEVKDDRAMSLDSAAKRKERVESGVFFDDMALKMRNSVEDLLESGNANESEFSQAFARVWQTERRKLVLWWERGPTPPSGPGTLDDRWKARWAVMTNTFKQRVSDLTPRVLVGGRPFIEQPDAGVTVRDLPAGIARRQGRE